MKKTGMAMVISALAALAAFGAGISPAAAETGVSGTTTVRAGSAPAGIHVSADLGAARNARDTAIDVRVAALNSLQTRVNAMVRVSAGQKASLSASIQTALQSMSVLKAKIDADTDAATLRSDVQAITKDNRVYALILPQGRIEASVDREQAIIALMDALGTKLQARITADQSAGKDVTAMQSAYADLQAKVADANTQSNAALSLVIKLQPDQGNQTTLQANTTALKNSVADIKTAESDLKAARKDAGTIAVSLKADGNSAKANVSASSK